jgi:hypothetical protein
MTDSETRIAKRHKVLKSGKMIFNRNQSVMDCTIRDLSDTGAKLIAKGAAHVPEEIRLLTTQDNMIRDARVIWRKDEMLGVHFVSDAIRAPSRKT